MIRELVTVDLGDRSYEIRIENDLLSRTGEILLPLLSRPRAAVITDENVADIHLGRLQDSLSASAIDMECLVLQSGECSKSWNTLQESVEWLLSHQFERRDTVIALGGGVIGDLAGFAAAVARRGLCVVQIPTTLLAQVDSAVGGKTGINSPSGKNLIGAFKQPELVLSDLDLLRTLPRRQILAGYAEIVKCGLLGDATFFTWLENHGKSALAGDCNLQAEMIRRSCEIKARIVERDETEQEGRAILNLGHTFAHALEAANRYSGTLLHGEAVSIGCRLAFLTSERMNLCSSDDVDRVTKHLQHIGMKFALCEIPGDRIDVNELVRTMQQDKKTTDGRVKFVLVRGIGKAFLCDNVDMNVILELLTTS